MASKTGGNASKGRKRKQYLPYNKSAKKKGAYPLYPGVQGFFITCDGGREFQATQEAINVIDSFYEELIEGKDPSENLSEKPNKPVNKKIKFSYSESSSSDDDGEEEENDAEDEEKENEAEDEEKENKSDGHRDGDANKESSTNEKTASRKQDDPIDGAQTEEKIGSVKEGVEDEANEAEEPPEKKQCIQTDAPKCVIPDKVEEKSIDKLIEAELQELGDKNKRRFSKLDSGCNGVVFVQMRKRDGDPSPKDIVQHMMTSAASTRKHMSRFILRVLPIEVSCYASEEEISRAIKPLVAQHFPVETENPQKYAVLYDARANTGIDRMKIIDSVAKCIPAPHKVDLKNPDKNIVVQICRTVCLIGVVEKYKELSKYNLRQLTSNP